MELQDFIGVYEVQGETWTELSKFKCKGGGNNLASLSWAPDGGHIIAVDSHLLYKLVVYTPSGEVVALYEAYQNALGIKQLVLHCPVTIASSAATTNAIVAVGSFDGVVRLLSPVSWRCAFELPLVHPKDMQAGLIDQKKGIVTTVEVTDAAGAELLNCQSNTSLSSTTPKMSSCYVSRNLKSLPKVAPDPNAKGAPKFGTAGLTISPDGLLLACRDESAARCLWIWDLR